MESISGHLPDVARRWRAQQIAAASRPRQQLKSLDWIDSTLIMSLRNGGGRGQKRPYATANLNQHVAIKSMFLHIRNSPYFLSNFPLFILRSDKQNIFP